ncbi:MAG TPA: hypothetical protein EYN96_10055 [Candidatus Hydrogenedentes bacterium]|nr:hypothetical protein [Candidatus Hydrogenedentota bacterium]
MIGLFILGDFSMLLVFTVSCLIAASPFPTVWFDASDLGSGSFSLEEPGTYTVWVWDLRTASRTRPALTLDKSEIALPNSRRGDKEYIWHKLDAVRLSSGKHSVELSETVARFVLTTDPTYRPGEIVKDMQVLDVPEAVRDRRAHTAKHTDTVFTFPVYRSIEEWESKAEVLRRRILLSSGLWPLPNKTPLDAQVFGRVQHDDYSVEKVHFQAWPGFYVTGNLYRPVGEGPFPAVYCPHGHWEEGRLVNNDINSIPGRSITLARMGAVVFTVDMVGYNDSSQFEHRWSKDEYKLWGIHPFALQLWGSVRALDFLQSLPDVDPERIGVTGASGGGTQTFALMAVDERVKVAAPVNMISSTMQGGCVCENAPLIRFENSNMEIGALMAPRPLLMISATGDWTRETPHVEYPAIRSIYELYGAVDRIENVHIDAGHNYNKSSREAMYRFFGKHLIDPEKDWGSFTEPPFEVESEEKLRVFINGSYGHDSDEEVIATIKRQIELRVDSDYKKIIQGDTELAERYRLAFRDTLGATIPESNELASIRISMDERTGYVVERWILGRKTEGDAIPAILYRAKDPGRQDAVVLVSPEGKRAFADARNIGPGTEILDLIEDGKAVLTIDTFLTGEHHSPYKETKRTRIGGFMDTFQPTDTAYRIQDILTSVAYIRARRDMTGNVKIVGVDAANLWVRFAAVIDPTVKYTQTGESSFDSGDDEQWEEKFYIPSIRTLGPLRISVELSN